MDPKQLNVSNVNVNVNVNANANANANQMYSTSKNPISASTAWGINLTGSLCAKGGWQRVLVYTTFLSIQSCPTGCSAIGSVQASAHAITSMRMFKCIPIPPRLAV